MRNKWKEIGCCFMAGCFMSACHKADITMQAPQAYQLAVPANFPVPVYETYNPLTKEGVALGRKLFYDVRLSGNNRISCSSCHRQELAFSDGVALTSIGVAGTPLLRHSPALINMAWANNGLFWDGGSTNLESQAFSPLSAHDEMSQNLYELVDELNADPVYVQQFRAAFKQEITSANVVKALAQFQRTLISANSRYDKYIRKENGGSFTKQEKNGLQLVQQKCQGCHTGDLFTDNQYHNNGLDSDFSNTDHDEIFLGRYRVTRDGKDMGAYKTPTLRNIMLTAPYMHDGRFATIEAVLEHYAGHVELSPGLSPLMYQQPGNTAGIPISAQEKKDIIAFLKTLTDEDFITNKKLGKP